MGANYGGYPSRGPGFRGGNSDRGGNGAYGNKKAPVEPPKPIEAMPLPANYVDEAERVIGEGNWSKEITTSKIRRLFSLFTDIYNDEIRRTAETISAESSARLRLAQIRMLYEAGRDPKTKQFLKSARLVEYLKDIGSSRAKLLDYFHYMEALVAYHKYYGGKEA